MSRTGHIQRLCRKFREIAGGSGDVEAGEIADVVAGEVGPGVQGADECERGAVVHAAAAMGDDELVLGGEGGGFARKGEEVGGGLLAEPVPVGYAGAGCQAV